MGGSTWFNTPKLFVYGYRLNVMVIEDLCYLIALTGFCKQDTSK
jgi:hypothetical protein